MCKYILRIHSNLLNKMNSGHRSVWHSHLSEISKNSLCCTQRALKCDIWVLNNNHFDENLNIPEFPLNAVITWQPGVTLWQDIHSFIFKTHSFSLQNAAEQKFSLVHFKCVHICVSAIKMFYFTLLALLLKDKYPEIFELWWFLLILQYVLMLRALLCWLCWSSPLSLTPWTIHSSTAFSLIKRASMDCPSGSGHIWPK